MRVQAIVSVLKKEKVHFNRFLLERNKKSLYLIVQNLKVSQSG